ncbi:uncharacterized protein LOC128610735 [Ictalurus furcatus]|uniref:uncharacterized protein LOC128610735 n=1 Tax=Ictalurus furcatus TaxID=66913 RepID=UPI00234FE584|nr:uncharacterized protein LOC128610735 [Ictalurus furcatus]
MLKSASFGMAACAPGNRFNGGYTTNTTITTTSSSSSSTAPAPPPAPAHKAKQKGFCLVRMMNLNGKKGNADPRKQQHQHGTVPFIIHCHIGKEIKHICGNCSRATDAQDGESLHAAAQPPPSPPPSPFPIQSPSFIFTSTEIPPEVIQRLMISDTVVERMRFHRRR